MHGFASDNWFRGPRVYFILGVLTILAASGLRAIVAMPLVAGYLDSVAISAGAIYAVLIFLYERWGWRWLSTLKDLNGTWVGQITTTHNGGGSVDCVMRMRQTWTRMGIELETANSRSRTTMAALYEDQPGDNGLKYEYVSEPRNLATPTMQTHRGVCLLNIVTDPDALHLTGDYFTGRGRETRGEIKLHRISRALLGFDAALKKEKE